MVRRSPLSAILADSWTSMAPHPIPPMHDFGLGEQDETPSYR